MADLSPAARQILAAYENSPFEYDTGHLTACAAVLRAAAHHLQRRSPWPSDVEGIGIDWSTSELHDIAAELEGQ
jgi:hypothetical protein